MRVVDAEVKHLRSNTLYESLIALLPGEENKWKAKQKEFMKNILKLLCYRRDTEEDFVLNFSVLTEMMNLTTLTNNAIKFKHLANKVSGIEDFVKFVSSSIGVDYQEFLNGDSNNKKWLNEMKKASQNTDLQGVYDASVSARAWRGVITNLSIDAVNKLCDEFKNNQNHKKINKKGK